VHAPGADNAFEINRKSHCDETSERFVERFVVTAIGGGRTGCGEIRRRASGLVSSAQRRLGNRRFFGRFFATGLIWGDAVPANSAIGVGPGQGVG
jgi:hypothetical protein